MDFITIKSSHFESKYALRMCNEDIVEVYNEIPRSL